jgi:putative transposase
MSSASPGDEPNSPPMASRVLGVSASGYYDWRDRAPSPWAIRQVWLTDLIREVHIESFQVYGALRVHAELTLGRGIIVGHNTIGLLMRRNGIKGLPNRHRPRPRHDTPTAVDLVDRDFVRAAPNTLWVTDITEHPTREGKVYCAVVLDVHSGRVVGWSIDSSQTAALATNALGMAISNRSPLPARAR